MSNVLRNPWLAAFVHEKLAEGIAERDRGAVAPGKVLDTIGALGELQFPGDRFKPLQVIQFLSLEDPVFAVLSDKSCKITCKFSPAAKSEHEASHGRITNLKGGIIKPKTYDIRFLGADGRLFWKCVSYQNQIADEPVSQKTKSRAKKSHQSSTDSGKPVPSVQGVGNAGANFKNVPTPEPILYITSFALIGSTGSEIWGTPASITSKSEIKDLLTKLPRNRYTKEEVPVRFKHNSRSIDMPEIIFPQAKGGKRPKSQSSEKTVQRFSRKNILSKLSKPSPDTTDLIDEMRSQPETISGGEEEVEESQLGFATQAPGRFPSTYDDLEFSTPVERRKEAETKVTFPLTSLLPSSSFLSTGHSPRVVIVTKSQQNPKPNQATTNMKENPAEGGSKGMAEAINSRHKRKFRRNSSVSESGSASVGLRSQEASGLRIESLTDRGWQGMTVITKADTLIPQDQQELLDRPESWYPLHISQNNQYTSGYNLVSKVQPTPKSHTPRNRAISPDIQAIVHAVPILSQPSPTPSDNEEIPWPSSPARPPEIDINAMPPDSSIPSGSQSHHIGGHSTQVDHRNKGRNMEDGSPILQQKPTPLKESSKGTSLPLDSPQSARKGSEETEEKPRGVATGKRVTRAANGISKKAPVDPNNTEFTRMAKANRKPKVSIARKHRRAESESDAEEPSEEYESSEDELINDPNLPFEVVNPNGLTRVDKFGGILKAQQVEMWEKQKRKTCGSQGDTEDETQSNYDDQVYDDLGSGDESGSNEDGLQEVIHDIVGPIATKPGPLRDMKEFPWNFQSTIDHSHGLGPSGPGNNLMEIEGKEKEEQSLRTSLRSHDLEAISSLPPSGRNHTTILDVERDRTLEKTLSSPAEPPVVKQTDIDTDDEEEIPQAPLVPLNITANTDTKAPGLLKLHGPSIDQPGSTDTAEITLDSRLQFAMASSNNSPKFKGQPEDRQVILSQTSSTLDALDAPVNQDFVKTPTSSSLPSSTSNTAPTIQVEETPCRKGCSKVGSSQYSSPTVKSRAGSNYLPDEFGDITLIPGTNTEELQNPSASAQHYTTRQSIIEQNSSPRQRQMISLNHVPSSAEISHPDDDLPNDFPMLQRQLQREMQQHMVVEVPATSEVDETRIEESQSQPPSPQNPSKVKKFRPIRGVDFQSQEIRAANAINDVSSMLERQKKQFLGLKDGCDFGNLNPEGDYKIPSEAPDVKVETFKIRHPLNVIEAGSSPARALSARTHAQIILDGEDVASNISQPNVRKRHQSPRSDIPGPAKRPRADDGSIHETSRHSTSAPFPDFATQDKVEAPTGSRNKSPSIAAIARSVSKDGISEPNDNSVVDIIASFPTTNSPIDEGFESTWPPQTPSAPEMYARIRERHLYVPCYGKLTDNQKRELDKRRQDYFGMIPCSDTKRLFTAGLQHNTQGASLSPLLRGKAEGPKVRGISKTIDDNWWRDENTPLKVFYRKFKELKQVKAELAMRASRGGSSDGNV